MKIVFCMLLTTVVLSYLELPLTRVPASTKHIDVGMRPCPKPPTQPAQNSETSLYEPCFHKDVAYIIQLFHHDQLYRIAIDLSVPVSWLKSSTCHTIPQNKKCSLLDKSLKKSISQKVNTIENKLSRRHREKELNREKQRQERQKPKEEVQSQILGMDTIVGTLEKGENIEFWTKDSSKFASFFKILLVGMFLSEEKDKIPLQSTNFINATNVTTHLNELCDGALSLRFDDFSENSFLDEIFTYVGEPDKVVTLFVGDNSTITIGELSIKNTEEGYEGISWFNLGQNRLPLFDQLSIEEVQTEKIKSVELSLEAIFTLSASYLSFPEKIIKELITMLDSGCQVMPNQGHYIQCDNNRKIQKKRLILEIGETKISLAIDQLVRDSKSHKILLSIRQSEPENNYIILGQPIFNKYFMAFHYSKNKIGIAIKRTSLREMLFDIITLVRFLTFIFFSGCSFILCYRPLRQMFKTIRLYYKVNNYSEAPTGERRGLRYSTEDENPYDEVSGKLQELAANSNEGI